MRFDRLGELERSMNDGVIPMSLATDGEAADRNILDIDGAVLEDSIPFILGHEKRDPRLTIGSIQDFVKERRTDINHLRAAGRIELEGKGMEAETRRDIALMAAKGHLRHVSVSWDTLDAIPRSRLPKAHRWRSERGFVHRRWKPLEGSIVGIGADPAALISHSRDASSPELRQVWEKLAEEAAGPEDASGEAVRMVLKVFGDARDLGLSWEDIQNLAGTMSQPETDCQRVELGEHSLVLPISAVLALTARERDLQKQLLDGVRPVFEKVEPGERLRPPVTREPEVTPHDLVADARALIRKELGSMREENATLISREIRKAFGR